MVSRESSWIIPTTKQLALKQSGSLFEETFGLGVLLRMARD